MGCARRPRDAALGVGRVLLDAHELVEELIDAEREPAELRVVQLEPLVGLPVEDREQPLLEHVDGPRDVVAEQPAADDDEDEADRQRPEDRQRAQASSGLAMSDAGAAATSSARLPSSNAASGDAATRRSAVAHDVRLLVRQGVLERVLRDRPAIASSSGGDCWAECATTSNPSPFGTTRTSARPVVASLTRESVSFSGRPMTSAPMILPWSSRTATYDAR